MKQYPSIHYPSSQDFQLPYVGFEKLDGSNIRAEYTTKKGFYKFGTRTQLIKKDSPFNIAIGLFLEKYSSLKEVFDTPEYKKYQPLTCYAELHGESSMFGLHNFLDPSLTVTLFDVWRHKKGFIPPLEFINTFSKYGIPKIWFREAFLTEELIESINNWNLTEGLILKSNTKYLKIKTREWFERLKEKDYHKFMLEMKEQSQMV